MTAPNRQSDCAELQFCSRYVHYWITKQSTVKEETITDWLLFEVSRRISRIHYRSFSRADEARLTGADWEWWFRFSDMNVLMRIQAKKVLVAGNNRPHPHLGKLNQHGLQIDKLLADARRSNALAFYALYTSLNLSTMCPIPLLSEGVNFASAERFYTEFFATAVLPFIRASDMLSRSIPLSCFLCCPLTHDGKSTFANFIQRYFPEETLTPAKDDVRHETELPRGFHKDLPAYVLASINYGEGELPESWVKEYGHSVEGLSGLVVYDLRTFDEPSE